MLLTPRWTPSNLSFGTSDERVLYAQPSWAAADVLDYLICAPYMDASWFARLSICDVQRGRLQPYIRTLGEANASVPDGICWPAPDESHELDAPCRTQVLTVTVRPVLPSHPDHLCNRWKDPYLFLHAVSSMNHPPSWLRCCASDVTKMEPPFIMHQSAQTMRAFLLAGATAATLLFLGQASGPVS